MIALKPKNSILLDMRQIFSISLGIVLGSTIVFLMFIFVAKIVAPYDIFGIKDWFASHQRDAWETWQREHTIEAVKTAIDDYYETNLKIVE